MQWIIKCIKTDDGYVCHLGDSNYLFEKCDILLFSIGEPIESLNLNDVLHDLHFVYVQNGKRVKEPNFQTEFTLREVLQGPEYLINCNIARPSSLPLVENKDHPVKIELHFKSNFVFEQIQFNVESSYVDNHRPKSFISKLLSRFK